MLAVESSQSVFGEPERRFVSPVRCPRFRRPVFSQVRLLRQATLSFLTIDSLIALLEMG